MAAPACLGLLDLPDECLQLVIHYLLLRQSSSSSSSSSSDDDPRHAPIVTLYTPSHSAPHHHHPEDDHPSPRPVSLDYDPPRGLHGRPMQKNATDAFALACTCRRLLRLFCVEALLQLDPFVASPEHPTSNYHLHHHHHHHYVPHHHHHHHHHHQQQDEEHEDHSLQTPNDNPGILTTVAAHTPGPDPPQVPQSPTSPSPPLQPMAPFGTLPIAHTSALYPNHPPHRTAALPHLLALIRLAGPCLKHFGLHAHPPERPSADQPLVPNFPIPIPGHLFEPLDPLPVFRALDDSRADLQALRLQHPKLLFTPAAVAALTHLLSLNAQNIHVLHIANATTQVVHSIRTTLPHPGNLKDLRLSNLELDVTVVMAILTDFGPGLETLELGCKKQEGFNSFAVCTALSSFRRLNDPEHKANSLLAALLTAARSCRNMKVLSFGSVKDNFALLALLLTRNCPKLRSLTLYGLSGHLRSRNCHATIFTQSALTHCPNLEDIHMVDCNIVGESAELFRIVGKHLRSFTGPFFWETSKELLMFSEYCPNVGSVSLRCGGDSPNECSEGAVVTLQRLGPKLRDLSFSNFNLSDEAFVSAACAATCVEELKLACDPKPPTSVFDDVLSAIGRQIRFLTIGWKHDEDAPVSNGMSDLALLRVICRCCPLLESLHLPDLWYDAGVDEPFSMVARETILMLHSQLQYFSIHDSIIGTSRNPLLNPL